MKTHGGSDDDSNGVRASFACRTEKGSAESRWNGHRGS